MPERFADMLSAGEAKDAPGSRGTFQTMLQQALALAEPHVRGVVGWLGADPHSAVKVRFGVR